MILQKILAHKKTELVQLKKSTSLRALESLLQGLPSTRPLAPALRRPGQVALIAEVKKASPSKGILCHDFDPVKLAREYEQNGAAAVSVLTEEAFFLGHPSHLVVVRDIIHLPVLRKDFIIDPYQIYESRVLGADAVLLIAAALPGGQLLEFRKLAEELDLSCLVEVHTEEELERALAAGAGIIGINNRDLHTFATDLNRTFSLMGLLHDPTITVVSESGIQSRADILKLQERGVHAALVGEALVRRASPGEGLRELAGFPAPGRKGGVSMAVSDPVKVKSHGIRDVSEVMPAVELNPGNIKQAVDMAIPYDVDVSGEAESGGKKELEKNRLFNQRARGVY